MCSSYRITFLQVWLFCCAIPSSSFPVFVRQADQGIARWSKICRSNLPSTLHATGNNDSMEENNSVDASESVEKETRNPPLNPPQLDPLFLAVTKMDPQTVRARSLEIPIWGELILDRSLFVLLPISVFAIGGLLLSVFVLINSGDTFVDAIVENSFQQSVQPATTSINEEGCRGLCSSQAQDLEGLRSYMQRLGGR